MVLIYYYYCYYNIWLIYYVLRTQICWIFKYFWTQYQLNGKLLQMLERGFLPRSSCPTYSSSLTAGTFKTKAVSSSETSVTIILYDVILVDLNSILVSFFDYPEDVDSKFRQNVCKYMSFYKVSFWGDLNLHRHCRDKGGEGCLANVLLQLGHLKVYVWYSFHSGFLCVITLYCNVGC